MKRPVCVTCRLFYKPKKNGFVIEEGAPMGNTWSAYKLWMGDLYECRGCGSQIVIGFGLEPIAEHYEQRYSRMREVYPPVFRVDDC